MSVELALYILAGLCGVAMVGLVAWSLFGDRSRGRKRCPKCAYSMDGTTGFVCPECGRDARDVRRLYRTHRHWWRAILAILLLGTLSVLSAGAARVKQTGGWADMPNWVVVRLMWIDDDQLDEDVGRRVRRGLLEPADVQLVVDEALRRIESDDPQKVNSGLTVLGWVSRNSYIYAYDPGAIARPMLEELDPQRITSALLALADREPAHLATIVDLLRHVKDADLRALLQLIEMMETDDLEAAVHRVSIPWRSCDSGAVRRLPEAPSIVLDSMYAWHPDQRPVFEQRARNFGKAVAERNGNIQELHEWSRNRWEDGCADENILAQDRLPELWLWCRLDGFGAESLKAVIAATENEDIFVRRYVPSLFLGFDWTPEIGTTLERLLDADDARVRSAAANVIVGIGRPASSMIPAILRQAATAKGVGGSSGFGREFVEMGGDATALCEAIVHRLELVFEHHLDRTFIDRRGLAGPGPTYEVVTSLWWLSDLAPQSERAAAICEKFMGVGEFKPSMAATKAYAAITGDASLVTKFVLERNPDLDEPFYADSPQEALLHLVQMRRADVDMIVQHYMEKGENERRALVSMLHTFIYDWVVIEPFLPFLRSLADDEYAQEQSEAKGIIDRYEDFKRRDPHKK